MDLSRQLKTTALIVFLIALATQSVHTRYHGRRYKRQNGAHLYHPETFIIPGGEGNPDEWGPWSSPSECSRSCGGGVSYQTRECLIYAPSGAPLCKGGNRKYYSCNTQDCPDDEPDFRAQQCSRFNSIPFDGVRYEWVPYTKAPNPCELNCMPRGERFYYRHKAKVIDGTRCNDQSLDVCVDGKCESVGCDMLLGSSAREDKCRKCAGDGSSCRTINGTFDANNLQLGYNDILLIPTGATNIDVHEIAPSNNYFACRNLSGHYYLNGNWRIDFPRPMFFAGAWWHYDRRPQGFAAPDKLTCIGPTTEAIYIVLLSQDRNVGIKYEYSLPESTVKSPQADNYTWTVTAFTPCSVSCGGGIQTRNVTCNVQTTLEQVDESLCDSTTKPANLQQCGQEECAPRWVEGPWGKCSKPCGTEGQQERTVHCERVTSSGVATEVEDMVCLEQAGNKPATQQECNVGKVCPKWHIGPWKPCNKLCGSGVQSRKVICYTEENGRKKVLNDKECPDEKPETEKECMLQPCEGVDWITSSWSGCKSCGLTQETRTATCASKSGKIYNETFCTTEKPELTRKCKFEPCKYQWFSSEWSNCSAECGKGVQERIVICGHFDGKAVTPVENEKCDTSKKPVATQECEAEVDECPAQWFTGPWGECSKTCGGGERMREVLCLANGKISDKCNPDTIEFQSEKCNINPCTEDEMIPVDSTGKPIAEDEEEEECEEEDEEEKEKLVEITTQLTKEELKEGIDLDAKSTSESTLLTDELMLSDATGFELETTAFETSTDIPGSTLEGSGEETSVGVSEGSGDFSESTKISTEPSDKSTATELGTSETSFTETTSLSEITTILSTGLSSLFTEISSTLKATTYTDISSTDSQTSTTDITGKTPTTESSDTTEETSEFSTDLGSSSIYDVSSSTLDLSTLTSDVPTTSSDLSSVTTDTTVSSESTTESATELTSQSTTELTSESTTELTSESTTEITSESTTELTSESTTELTSESTSELTSESTSELTSEATTTTEETSTLSSESSSVLSTVSSTFTTTSESSTIESSSLSSVSTELTSTSSTETSSLTPTTEISTESSSLSVSTEGSSTDFVKSTESSTAESETGFTTISEFTEKLTGSTAHTEETSVQTTDATTKEETSSSLSTEETVTEESTVSTQVITTEQASTVITESTEEITAPTTLETVSTEQPLELTTTSDIDIWSTTTSYKKDGIDDLTTPYTLQAAITREQTPRKCKPRKKKVTCAKTKFGCCPDNTTVAKGPFDEGCPVAETCKDTKYGCCPDGLSPAKGKNNAGCPESQCSESLFGCCPDNWTPAENEDYEGCPEPSTTVGGCAASEFGCCPDGISEASGPDNEGCEETTTGGTTETTEEETTMEVSTEQSTTTEVTEEKACATSRYGCCPDGETEATGEDFQGCEKEDCFKSTYGCCKDNKTAASGPNEMGCEPCLTEPFGCCPDGRTPAHGRNSEGCCLNSAFGCCPDNINPARGPDDEGCDCEYSPYGCCPDKKTAARGHNNEGCGCEHTRYGCCPDKVTPAQGEKFSGCPCHSFQFGCCPDGITVPQGPHNYGCHCLQTEFKCCPDEKTPAKGPNYEGCTCAESKYGCCPDGVTEAKGNKFEGCENVQEPIQKSCALNKDLGPCSNFTVKYFFDTAYGACVKFWYGGCEGNANRFDTLEECQNLCEHYKGKETCLLPRSPGPCTRFEKKYYYDNDRHMCAEFDYGGCLGNTNKFDTLAECQATCAVDESLPPCEQPVDRGPCEGNFERWYFDNETEVCRPFLYGGCKGNKNNYLTEHACIYHCKKPGVHRGAEDNRIIPDEIRTAGPDLCESYREQCEKLRCPYGTRRFYGDDGCEQCDCENPCHGYTCPDGQSCAVDFISDSSAHATFIPVCRLINKPGECPYLTNTSLCDRECYSDADCRGDSKCCYNGCGHICVTPEEPQVTTTTVASPITRPGDTPPSLEYKPQNEIDVETPVGGAAVLRCYATGYPPPTITWRKGTLIINTNQGRYVLTASGDLTIVQVHKSDTGTYVCVADNGLGSPVSREVKLQVSVPASALIKPDESNTYAEGSDLVLNCVVDGYPTPNVTWHKDEVLLSPSKRIQITENPYRLIIYKVTTSDTGYYTCTAKNNFSFNSHRELITIKGVYIHPECVDNPFFANCALIVKGKYCNSNPFYAKFCCRSCTIAGQLPNTHPNSLPFSNFS